MPQEVSDVVIIGGGIVGLATAYRLTQRFPGQSVVVLEKEPKLAEHQTGHNSGVLHSGIYYRPGSSKAKNCRLGKQAMEAFCAEHQIPYDICGKVIVATREDELESLQTIYERGQANQVQCEIIGPERLRELEPHAAGIRAIHVPETGIVDYRQVCLRFGSLIEEAGGQIITSARVNQIAEDAEGSRIESTAGEYRARWLINCAGLHSDRVARMTGAATEAQIVPFRGEYYELQPAAYHLCRNLIYPVPDPKFPFLGVHFTRMINGSVECGPNAVLALAREGYRKTDLNLKDLVESLTYPGFLRLASHHWRMGLHELWRSFSKGAFVKALQRLIPEITAKDLLPAPAGVRAQAVARDGAMVDDFLIVDEDRIVNVCNAPSPAATSSLNIADTIVDRLAQRF